MSDIITAKELKSVILDLGIKDFSTSIDDIPNLIKLYHKYRSSINKAVVEFELRQEGLIIVKASKNIQDIIGYTPDELVGTPLSKYSLSNVDTRMMNTIVDLLHNGEVVMKNSSISHKEGGEVLTKGMLYKDKDKYVEFIWKANDEFYL